MPNLKPVLILIAGANGCGKTTITKNLLANPWTLGCEYINPDDLAKAMPGGWDDKENFVEGFTKKYKTHKLVYYEVFEEILNAITREKQIKGWLRNKKIKLIEKYNPNWDDLYETII